MSELTLSLNRDDASHVLDALENSIGRLRFLGYPEHMALGNEYVRIRESLAAQAAVGAGERHD